MAAPPSRAPPPGAGPPVLSPSAQKHVALFKDYYRHQLQLAPDDEAALYAALERPLPVTFRLVGALSEGFAAEEVAQLDAQLNATLVESAREAAAAGADAAAGAAVDDAERMALTRLEWYPHGAAWQLSAPKKRLKEARALQVALSLPPPQHPLSVPVWFSSVFDTRSVRDYSMHPHPSLPQHHLSAGLSAPRGLGR